MSSSALHTTLPWGMSLIDWYDSSDFENKFVCGEIMTFDDLKEHGSEAAVKAVRLTYIT